MPSYVSVFQKYVHQKGDYRGKNRFNSVISRGVATKLAALMNGDGIQMR